MTLADNQRRYYDRNRDACKARTDEWRSNNPGKVASYAQKWRNSNPEMSCAQGIISGIKLRARISEIPFDSVHMRPFTLAARLHDKPYCTCCGQEFDMTRTGKCGPKHNSPSIDRRIPALGYVKGNVSVICWTCNRVKAHATLEQLEAVVAWMKR